MLLQKIIIVLYIQKVIYIFTYYFLLFFTCFLDQVIIGETFTNTDEHNLGASTFDVAKTPNDQDFYDDYSSPQIINHITEEPPIPTPGPLEAVEEVPTVNEYYDGALNLNKLKVNCLIITTVTECTRQSGCGWCGSGNGCIFGTKFGPLQPCIQASYMGGVSYPNAKVNLRKVDEAVGGVTKTIISDVQ